MNNKKVKKAVKTIMKAPWKDIFREFHKRGVQIHIKFLK